MSGELRSTALATRLAMHWPFGRWRALQLRLARSRLLRATLWRGRLQRLDRLRELVNSQAPREIAIRRHLLASLAWPWLNLATAAAERRPAGEVLAWFTLEGLEHLEQARARGRGVILVFAHFGAVMTAPTALVRSGLSMYSIQGPNLGLGLHAEDAGRLQPLEIDPRHPGDVLERAKAALRAGEVVGIAPDGRFGEGGVEVDFLGRRRALRAGFATLAADTGAAVLPLLTPIDEHGRTRLCLLDPLPEPAADLERRDRVAALVRAYADVLAAHWRDDPANVHARHVRWFWSLPECPA